VRFLANENIPGALVGALRDLGHDVVWARQDTPGAPDEEKLAVAQSEARLVVTFDKDFGELAFRSGLTAAAGVILLRVPAPATQEAVGRLADVVTGRSDWAGHFSVIEPNRIRMTPLPPAGP
jgi:predicted nuclease of predicted toxin-antitoxin system